MWKASCKVKQVTKCVRFTHKRGKDTCPTMLHVLLHKMRQDSPYKRKTNFCVDGLCTLYATMHANKVM